jgi:hypothetical protein
MTSLDARALADDPEGCGLLRSVLGHKGRKPHPAWDSPGATKPALTDEEWMTRAVAAIQADTSSKSEVYSRLVQSFVVDLDLLAPVISQACSGARRTASAELAAA